MEQEPEVIVSLLDIKDFEETSVWRKLLQDFKLVQASTVSGLIEGTELPLEKIRELQAEIQAINRLLDYPALLREELKLKQKET